MMMINVSHFGLSCAQGWSPFRFMFFYANDDDDDYLKTGGQTRGEDMTTGYDNRIQFPVPVLATFPVPVRIGYCSLYSL